MVNRSPTAKRARRRSAPKTLARILEHGLEVEVLDERIGHMRITRDGVPVVDYWLTTEHWIERRLDGRRGNGLERMIAFALEQPAAPPAARGFVTLFADASFSHQTRAAGWAAWAKGREGGAGLTWSGPLKTAANSQQAEFFALVNGIACADRAGLLPADEFVLMLQSDCLEALATIRWLLPGVRDMPAAGGRRVAAAKRPSRLMRDCAGLEWLAAFAQRPGLQIVVRHVKGHQQGGGARAWVNNECDRLAKAARKSIEHRSEDRA